MQATIRSPERADLLRWLGAHEVLVDDGRLADQVRAGRFVVDALLDLVGNSALRDSLAAVRPRGRVCQAGFLGGLAPVADCDPLADLPSGVQLSFFGSAFVLGGEHFPLSAVPLGEIFRKIADCRLHAEPSRVFEFHEIVEAHRVMEEGTALGKMTVLVP